MKTGSGHALNFSALPSTFEVVFSPEDNQIILSDGSLVFIIGDSDDLAPNDVTMAGSTQLEYFTTVFGSDGNDVLDVSAQSTAFDIEGGYGRDSILGGAATTP